MVADVDAKIDGITALDYNECNNLFQLIQNTASYTIRYDTIRDAIFNVHSKADMLNLLHGKL